MLDVFQTLIINFFQDLLYTLNRVSIFRHSLTSLHLNNKILYWVIHPGYGGSDIAEKIHITSVSVVYIYIFPVINY